jgi:hypothetical protein
VAETANSAVGHAVRDPAVAGRYHFYARWWASQITAAQHAPGSGFLTEAARRASTHG